MKEGLPKSASSEEKSPWRLRALNKKFIEGYVSHVDVKGLEVLDRIPPEKKKVFVTTHISDFDMPIVLYALADRVDLLIGDMSPHHDPREDLQGYMSKILVGSQNFGRIDFKADKSAGIFNPENFKNIEEKMRSSGKSLLVAAHNPGGGIALPKKGGYGAAYLGSLLEDAIFIPVAVSLRSDKPVGLSSDYKSMLKERPSAEVTVGEPFELSKINGAHELARLMQLRKEGAPVSTDEVQRVRETLDELRNESDQIMEHLAEMLPKEKRGTWNQEGI